MGQKLGAAFLAVSRGIEGAQNAQERQRQEQRQDKRDAIFEQQEDLRRQQIEQQITLTGRQVAILEAMGDPEQAAARQLDLQNLKGERDQLEVDALQRTKAQAETLFGLQTGLLEAQINETNTRADARGETNAPSDVEQRLNAMVDISQAKIEQLEDIRDGSSGTIRTDAIEALSKETDFFIQILDGISRIQRGESPEAIMAEINESLKPKAEPLPTDVAPQGDPAPIPSLGEAESFSEILGPLFSRARPMIKQKAQAAASNVASTAKILNTSPFGPARQNAVPSLISSLFTEPGVAKEFGKEAAKTLNLKNLLAPPVIRRPMEASLDLFKLFNQRDQNNAP